MPGFMWAECGNARWEHLAARHTPCSSPSAEVGDVTTSGSWQVTFDADAEFAPIDGEVPVTERVL